MRSRFGDWSTKGYLHVLVTPKTRTLKFGKIQNAMGRYSQKCFRKINCIKKKKIDSTLEEAM